jgi:hypothetical protein
MGDIWTWLTDRNWKTWLGHFTWGVISGPVGLWRGFESGLWLVIGMFYLRELDDAGKHAAQDMEPAPWVLPKIKSFAAAYWASIKEDGFFDFVAPLAGYGLFMLIFGGLSGRNVVASLVVFLVSVAAFIVGHKLFKKKWPWQGMD